MNAETLKRLLEESSADAWQLCDTHTTGWEFYFIRHDLDQNRARDARHLNVTVYRKSEDGKMLGSASQEIWPTCSEDEAKEIIAHLLDEAHYVENPFYELNGPSDNVEGQRVDVRKNAQDFIRAMQSVPETETEDINSCEIFTDCVERRLMNSNGLDVTDIWPKSMLEVIVNARNSEHEIELYRSYENGSCDAEALKNSLGKAMQYGRDRLIAEPTPMLGKEISVLFSTDDSVKIYHYFAAHADASMKYQKISQFEEGKAVVSDVKGDRLTLKAGRSLRNSPCNAAHDAEGAPVRDEVLIDDGVMKKFLGSRKYSSYLGITDSFIPGNYEACGGISSEAQLRSGSYLEVVEFSDFQIDTASGMIAGEIRLAYLHEGENVRAVTGGSVSGNLRECAGNMRMSKEQAQYGNWLIPSVTLLSGVQVTGKSEN